MYNENSYFDFEIGNEHNLNQGLKHLIFMKHLINLTPMKILVCTENSSYLVFQEFMDVVFVCQFPSFDF